MRRTWPFRSVYLTIASGVQQRANTLKQEKGVPHFMSSTKHFRNFALSKVKNSFLKVLLGTDFTFWSVCLHWKGLIFIAVTFHRLNSILELQLFVLLFYCLYHIIQIFVNGKNVRQVFRIKLWLSQTDIDVLTELYCVISAITSFGSLLGFAWKWQ